MKILIVEDEHKTASFVSQGFSQEGFVVDVASDGIDGLHLAKTGHYDLIILDVMLPGRDGWSVLEELRSNSRDQPVILLTALDSVPERVRGLSSGADDYLVKPFAFSELLARARNVLKRAPTRQPDMLRYRDLEIDLSRHKVTRLGVDIELAPQEYRLLAFLMRNAEQVLTRTRIAEQVWDMNFDGDSNVIDVAVRRLRRKIDDEFPIKLIHTLRGVGYVLEERGEHDGYQ